jgi:small-conductance mechanosensitive channel
MFSLMDEIPLDSLKTTCQDAAMQLPILGWAAVILLAFWMAGVIVEKAIRRLGRLRHVDPDVMSVLARSAKIGMLLFGAMSGLAKLGLDISAMVAGLGLTGLAIGLALKEILSNALSGMLILAYKPFKRNDTISVLTFQGRVVEVDLRYTTLETATGRIFVPNTVIQTNAVIVSLPEAGPSEGMPEI